MSSWNSHCMCGEMKGDSYSSGGYRKGLFQILLLHLSSEWSPQHPSLFSCSHSPALHPPVFLHSHLQGHSSQSQNRSLPSHMPVQYPSLASLGSKILLHDGSTAKCSYMRNPPLLSTPLGPFLYKQIWGRGWLTPPLQELAPVSHLRLDISWLGQLLVFWGLYLPILGTRRPIKIVSLHHQLVKAA